MSNQAQRCSHKLIKDPVSHCRHISREQRKEAGQKLGTAAAAEKGTEMKHSCVFPANESRVLAHPLPLSPSAVHENTHSNIVCIQIIYSKQEQASERRIDWAL